LAAETPRQQQNAERARRDAIDDQDKWTRKQLLRRDSRAPQDLSIAQNAGVIRGSSPPAAELSIRT
jgi:hypothetical protein